MLDPGLGKTSIALAACKILKRERVFRRALVIAPLRVCYRVWPREQQKWSDFNDLKVVVLHGPNKDWALEQDADLYVINPEGLPWLLTENRFKRLAPDTLIVDESSKFKHTNTQRFKQIKPLLPTFKRRWILTGSPMPNGYLDLFGQIYIIDLGRALGQYITHYRFNYFYPTGYGGYTWVLKSGMDKLIQERIKPCTLRLDAEDYLDMPEIVENVIRVDLPEKAQKIYEAMEEEMFAMMDGGEEVTALNTAAASVKCRQIANGGIYHQAYGLNLEQAIRFERHIAPEHLNRKWTNLHTAKVDALRELVEELHGSPLLVAYDFEHDLERLRKEFGKDVAVMGGGTTMRKTAAVEDAWNAGELPILLAQPQAMGHGLNLQGSGHHVCWHSLTWDFELYDQFVRRVRREGQKHASVYVHHIVARNTVDEAMLKAMRSKAKAQNSLLDALRDYRKGKRNKVVSE